MISKNIGAVVTDLDGTLLTDAKAVNREDINVLHALGERGIMRIAATGRNLRIAKEVLADDFPIDYLVFSTGCGIYCWRQKKIIHADGLSWEQTRNVIDHFVDEAFDFTIHQPIPDNYKFYYHQHNPDNHHFNAYLKRYENFAQPLDKDDVHKDNFRIANACQLLAIIETDTGKYQELADRLGDVKLVRTTSPLNDKAMWIEVFPRHISKAWGVRYIREQYNVAYENMIGIGNDYNDIDFLKVVGHPFVVSNAHPDLRSLFPVVASNEACGVAEAIQSVIDL